MVIHTIVLSTFLFSFQFAYLVGGGLLYPLTGSLVFLSVVLKVSSFLKEPLNKEGGINLFFLIFSLYVSLSVLWSPSQYVGYQKFFFWGCFTTGAYFLAQRVSLKILGSMSLLLSCITLVGVFVALYQTKNAAFVFGNTYLVSGQTFGIGILICLINFRISFVFPLLLGAFLAALLFTGGRGPLLFVGVSIVYYCVVFYKHELKKTPFIQYAAFIASFCVVFFLCKGLSQTIMTLDRLDESLAPFQDGSLVERFSFYRSAIDVFLNNPFFGCGLSGWPVLAGLGDKQWHPHNLFLELLSETGIMGMSLFILFGWFYIKQKGGKKLLTHPLIVFFIFSFLNAMKSGDLNDNLLLWVILGLGVKDDEMFRFKRHLQSQNIA